MSIANDPGGAAGRLFVVATPIGNLEDLSPRAVRVLREAGLILAEDTRVSGRLLRHYGIDTPMRACHDHNERSVADEILARLRSGEDIAVISDAGTPLVSDPGFHLVRAAHAAGIAVVAIPGASAVIAALSVAGLPTDRFAFEGFLPAAAGARRARLEALRDDPRTLVFLEAPHRLHESLIDLMSVLGAGRPATLARELTKIHETVRTCTLAELERLVAADPNQRRGEIVLCVGGASPEAGDVAAGVRAARTLCRYLPTGKAAAAASDLTGISRKRIYAAMLEGGEGVPEEVLAREAGDPETSP